MTRILVTGASGLLGLNLCMELCSSHEVLGVVNSHGLAGAPFQVVALDLVNPEVLDECLKSFQPEVILHCAALANLDACEADPVLAQRLNAELPGQIARMSARRGIKLIHVSTDAVFDGIRGGYREEDAANPIGVYSRTKLEGEQAVCQADPGAIISRVNLFGWSLSGKRSLAEFFFNNLSAGKQVNGFTDVFFCPLLVNDLAHIFLRMVELDLQGLYHTVSSTCLSKYEFGCQLARVFGLDETLIQPCSWREGGLKAARSPNLSLQSDLLACALGEKLPDVESGLKRFHRLYQEGFPGRLRSMAG